MFKVTKKATDKPVDRRIRGNRRWYDSRREEIRWEPLKEDRRKITDRRKENLAWTTKAT